MHGFESRRGFTLLELLVTLAVAAIIMTIAIPASARLIQDVRVTVSVNRLVAALHLARSEAVRRGERVSLCPVDAGGRCHTAALADGWGIVPGEHPFHSEREAIRRYPGLPPGVTLEHRFGNVSAEYVSYLPTGETRRLNGGLLMGSLRVCDARNGRTDRRIVVNAVGRPRVTSQPCQ